MNKMMTREEAIERLEWYQCHAETKEDADAFDMAISTLRPVSRKQVEKVWRGEWHSHYKSGIHAGTGVVCSKCDMWNNRAAHFCPSCGAPMTDDAVQMVMERWKEAIDGEAKTD